MGIFSNSRLTGGTALMVENDGLDPLELLEARLSEGCKIEHQDGKWHIFEADGEGVCSGETIRELLINLIFTDC